MKNTIVTFTGVGKVEFQEEEIPDALPPGAILIESEYTFISAGTELANLTGREKKVFVPGSWCAYPWRPGYAQVGRVAATGDGASATVGERVFALCNHAAYSVCLPGTDTRRDFWIRVPDALDPVTAVATRMAMVAASAPVAFVPAWHSPGWVAVLGLGAVGNLAAQCYAILGAKVIGVDPVEARRALARRCGIESVIPGGDTALEQIRAITGGERPHAVIEATGSPKVAVDAINLVREQGDVVLLGSARGDIDVNFTDILGQIHYRNLHVHGALEWSLPRSQPAGYNNPSAPTVNNLHDKVRTLFDWTVAGRLKVAPLVSHVVRARDIAQGYEGLLHHPETYTGVAVAWG